MEENLIKSKYKNFIYYEINTYIFEDVLTLIYSLGGKIDEKN